MPGLSLSESSVASESASTGGAGLTDSSVLAVSDTPSDLLKTRSTREKNLLFEESAMIVRQPGINKYHTGEYQSRQNLSEQVLHR
jgi:hypothetical protein